MSGWSHWESSKTFLCWLFESTGHVNVPFLHLLFHLTFRAHKFTRMLAKKHADSRCRVEGVLMDSNRNVFSFPKSFQTEDKCVRNDLATVKKTQAQFLHSFIFHIRFLDWFLLPRWRFEMDFMISVILSLTWKALEYSHYDLTIQYCNPKWVCIGSYTATKKKSYAYIFLPCCAVQISKNI